MVISGNQLRPGVVIEYEGKLWQCMQAVHKTPGNLRAFVQAKMRNVRDGIQKEFRFSSTESLEKVELREREMQYLYSDSDFYHFMDLENYEQIQLTHDMIGEVKNFLLPDAKIRVTFFDETAIGISLPQAMEFNVIEAEPGIRTATASPSFKNATIETGLTVKVPQFVEAGHRIKVDTSTGEYIERVSAK